MTLNASGYCLSERELRLGINGFERVFIGKIVPVFIVFGVSGNILNLTVLLMKTMRTRSNLLLASLAVADIVFLLFMLPHSLAHYSIFYHSEWFRRLYLGNKMHLLAILNWASAAAVWLILVVCLERLMGIKYPLSVRKHKKLLTPAYLVPFILVTTGVLTSYIHFSYSCAHRYFCNGTQFHAMCIRTDSDKWFRNQANPHSDLVRGIATYGTHVNAIAVVFVPIVLVLFSNAMLIITLRQRQKQFASNASTRSEAQMTGGQARTEHRITITVCAIVTCFTITQGPSAFVTILALYYPLMDNDNSWMVVMILQTSLITTLVVVGKANNFVLFCLSSATFRSRLLQRTKQSLGRNSTRKPSAGTGTSSVFTSSIRNKDSLVSLQRPKPKANRVKRAFSATEELHPLRTTNRGMSIF